MKDDLVQDMIDEEVSEFAINDKTYGTVPDLYMKGDGVTPAEAEGK